MYRQKKKRNKGWLTPLSILSLNWTFFPFANIVARPIGLAAIIVIMTVSIFKTAVIQYISWWLYILVVVTRVLPEKNQSTFES